MSRRGALGQVLESGSAKHGVGHWWAQRLAAMALVLLSVWFTLSVLTVSSVDYESVKAWMSRSWNAVLMIALIVVGAQHSYLGLRVVVEDYVHGVGRRIAILLLLRLFHVLLAAAGVFAVLRVAFGAST